MIIQSILHIKTLHIYSINFLAHRQTDKWEVLLKSPCGSAPLMYLQTLLLGEAGLFNNQHNVFSVLCWYTDGWISSSPCAHSPLPSLANTWRSCTRSFPSLSNRAGAQAGLVCVGNQESLWGIVFHFHGGMTWVLLSPSHSQLFFLNGYKQEERKWHFGFSGMAQPGGSQDTLTVPPKPLHDGDHVGLNEDLVRILRENLLQQERPRLPRDRRSMSPRLSPITLSPRNSPRLLRRMLLNNNTHKQRRFTVAHTW